MKVFAIPTICGAVNAAGSLIFFGLFAYFYSDASLARLVLIQAVVAMAQVVMIPQCWLYVLGGTDSDELEERYWSAIIIEVSCYFSALLIIAAFLQLPISLIQEYKYEALLFFVSLGLTGMSSHQGFFRARHAWFWLGAWMILPTMSRLVILALSSSGILIRPDQINAPIWYILIFFVVPDILRMLFINMPWAVSRVSKIHPQNVKLAFRSVSHNWLYDMGSGFCDHIDKVFVGILARPGLFVLYFFARRIGNSISIVLEPYLAEMYRRMVATNVRLRPNYMQRTLFHANLIGAGVAILGIVGILVVRHIEFISGYIPISVSDNWYLFFMILLIDGCVAGSRWSRFVFQSGRTSVVFLLVRIALKFVFAAGLLLIPAIGDMTIAIMFGIIWGLEYLWVAARARKLDRAAQVDMAGLPAA